jgi:magnesium-transporting ATPase (P-type)
VFFFRTINLQRFCYCLAVRDTILIDQSALTGESIPISKSLGDEILCNAICKQGEAEAIG